MRLSSEFVRLPLRFDADQLAAEVLGVAESQWRPHPQGFPGNSALPLVAAGGDPYDDAAAGPMLPTPVLSELPYLRQVLAATGNLGKIYRLGDRPGSSVSETVGVRGDKDFDAAEAECRASSIAR